MTKTINLISRAACFIVLFVALLSTAQAADKAHPNDVARFLAGLEPSSSSSLDKLAETKSWQRHAKLFDSAWNRVEDKKLREARDWASRYLNSSKPAMFYMFSGPDFLYADTFFPNAKTYILTGLEPVGRVPNVKKLSNSAALENLRQSLNSVLNFSFFITKRMKTELNTGFKGTLPIIMVFMARTGKTIKDVSYVTLHKDGTVKPYKGKGSARGLKITFDGSKTLYYFSTDLANHGVRRSGLMKFAAKLGKGDSLVKSASYLMHLNSFSTIRKFLLENSAVIVQDDSGIPVRHFSKKEWNIQPFGKYKGPIPLFKQHYQKDLAKLYKTGNPESVKFGIGYRWRTYETNFLLAEKK